jgi:hypothetical protein
LLVRSLGLTSDATLAKFDDNTSISSWAQAAVAQSVQVKIISGIKRIHSFGYALLFSICSISLAK